MIRLTLLLIAAIGVTMLVAGDPPQVARTDAPEPAPEVTRAIEPRPQEVAEGPPDPDRLALDDEQGAIERALAAAMDAPSPEPEPETQQASLEVIPPATPQPATAEPEGAAADGLWFVTGSQVNLRAGPSTGEAVVGRAGRGDAAEMLEQSDDGWMRIRLADSGQEAWIFGRFLSPDRPG